MAIDMERQFGEGRGQLVLTLLAHPVDGLCPSGLRPPRGRFCAEGLQWGSARPEASFLLGDLGPHLRGQPQRGKTSTK